MENDINEYIKTNLSKQDAPLYNLARIAIQAAIDTWGVDIKDFMNNSRVCHAVQIRAFIAIALREYNVSLKKIGRILKRDHTSIIHIIRNYNECMKYDKYIANEFKRYRNNFDMLMEEELND